MSKKTLGIIIDFRQLHNYVSNNKLFLKKFSENFKELIFIDANAMQKGRNSAFWDTEVHVYHETYSVTKNRDGFLENLEKLLPLNYELFEPKNLMEFDEFLKKNTIYLITNLDRAFKNFGIFFKLKKNKIKQFIISNKSVQNNKGLELNNLFKKLSLFFKKRIQQKIYSLLCMINIFNKVEIRFDSNLKIYNWWKKNQKQKKIFFWKKTYYKKLVTINSLAYDESILTNLEISNDYIVMIDANVNHKDDVSTRGLLKKETEDKHYALLNKHLEHLSKIYKKEVIVCIHPQYDLKKTQKYFQNFKVFKHRTREFIYKSFLVVFYDSSSIIDAFLLKKNIISLKPDFDWSNDCTIYNKDFGIVFLDITKEDERKIEEKKLTENLDIAKINYKKFINTYIKPEIDPELDNDELGVDVVVKTIKEC